MGRGRREWGREERRQGGRDTDRQQQQQQQQQHRFVVGRSACAAQRSSAHRGASAACHISRHPPYTSRHPPSNEGLCGSHHCSSNNNVVQLGHEAPGKAPKAGETAASEVTGRAGGRRQASTLAVAYLVWTDGRN
ncbi:hypothetical protein PLESTF_000956900 [Pleodorina starrii]|nr:hypothetical protein PLESTM_001884800 [Pleodorina starrii]GLC70302.1 hypothetical protein PLESTF_000956900 [Pleodorina starrii]